MFQSLLPGYAYRKLFMRMVTVQESYVGKGAAGLDAHLREVWSRTGDSFRA